MTIQASMQFDLLPQDLRGLVPIAVCPLCDDELYRPEHLFGDLCSSCACACIEAHATGELHQDIQYVGSSTFLIR